MFCVKRPHANQCTLQKNVFLFFFRETEINDGEIKRKKLVTNSCQTDTARLELAKITEEDLITDGEPSEGYWKVLAEKRRDALEITLRENEELCDEVNSLRAQLDVSNQMLDESKNLVEILTEMLQENENNDPSTADDKGECSKDLINASLAEEANEDHNDEQEDVPPHYDNPMVVDTPPPTNNDGDTQIN